MRLRALFVILSILVIEVAYCQAPPYKKPHETYVEQKNIGNEVEKKAKLIPFSIPDPASMVSIDQSGDGTIALPVVTVKGRNLALPITLTYTTSGIKAEQSASEVGLGWNITFGSITRDYGAFEPDYTSNRSEFKMKDYTGASTPNNDNKLPWGTVGTSNAYSSGGAMSPLPHEQYLEYSGVNAGKGPDIYQLSIPGIQSNNFWNNNKVDDNSDPTFIFSEKTPLKISYEKKTYEVMQEISRINEIAFQENFASGTLQDGYNMAAAIGMYPYVKNANTCLYIATHTGIWPESALYSQSQFYVMGNETPKQALVTYEDIANFTIVSDDGTTYVFGRPLRGQKYIFGEEPFWSTGSIHNSNHSSAAAGEFWKTDFIAEWLLTEVRSRDYVDANQNGFADDADKGDWIKINYTDPVQYEGVPGLDLFALSVPKHREWLNFSQTDKYSSIWRERAYVTSIVTPTETVEFTNSERFDVDHDYFNKVFNNLLINAQPYIFNNISASTTFAQQGSQGQPATQVTTLDVSYPIELKKYDLIKINDKTGNLSQYVKFNYATKGSSQELAVSDYLIIDNAKNFTPYDPASCGQGLTMSATPGVDFHKQTGRGKTTLIGIDYGGNDLNSTEKISYAFEYGFNPKYDDIHKYQIRKQAAFAPVRESHKVEPRWNSFRNYDPTHPIFNSMLPWHWLQFDQTALNSNGNNQMYVDQAYNNSLLTDELGYYYNSSLTNKGRDAWSLTSIISPYGGKINLTYELDNFDVSGDREIWKASGIPDYCIPAVGHYNNVAHLRSVKQDIRNNPVDPNLVKKHLYREYYFLMNSNTGRLRVKQLSFFDQYSNSTTVKTYNYGTGHFTCPPADYWQNYVEGFNAFVYSEQIKHDFGEKAHYELAWEQTAAELWQFNDYTNSMCRLIPSVRIDRSISDGSEHYYEYIDEVNGDGSKTRRYFGKLYRPVSNPSPIVHSDVKLGVIKSGDERRSIVEILAVNVDQSVKIGNYKTEYFKSSTKVKEESADYAFDEIDNNQIELKELNMAPIVYQVWGYYNAPWDKLGTRIPSPPVDKLFPINNPSIIGKLGYNYDAPPYPTSGTFDIDLVGEAREPFSKIVYTSGLFSNPPSWFQPIVATSNTWASSLTQPDVQQIVSDIRVAAGNGVVPYYYHDIHFYEDYNYKVKALTFKSHQSYFLRPTHKYSVNYY